jgi:hypothetical protein
MSLITLPAPTSPPVVVVKKKLKDLRQTFGRQASVDRASFFMLQLYRSNLEVRLRSIEESSLQTEGQRKIFHCVTDLLKGRCSTRAGGRDFEWDEVYKAERLIVLLYGGPQLRQEISARLQELAAESVKDAESMRRDYEAMLKPAADGAAVTPDDGMHRMFLLRIMEALHWNAKKKYLSRPLQKEGTKIVLYGVFIAFLLIVAPYLVLNFWGEQTIGKWWSVFALYTALSAGLMGAFFSRLVDAQRRGNSFTLDEVFMQRELSYTLLRAGVGVCGALIIYFFLRSDFVSGPLFPVFEEVAIRYVRIDPANAIGMVFVMPSKALALLTFWCFLAGFSEQLVPNILAGTERQLTQAGSAPQKSRD